MPSREIDHAAYSWMCRPQTWPEGGPAEGGEKTDGVPSIDIVGREGYKEMEGDVNGESFLLKPRQDRASYV